MSKYAKAIAAFLTTLSGWGVTASPNGIDGAEWWGLLGVLTATFAVYAVPNSPPAQENTLVVPGAPHTP